MTVFYAKRLSSLSTWLLLGIALGYGVGVSFWPGGYDALVWYMRPWFSGTTAPAWVYGLTHPLSLLGWPLSWQALVVLTVLVAGITARVWGNKNWWVVVLSSSLMWTIWLGQIELFPVMGLLITGLVLQGKIHPAWLGVSWLALMTKPQVGLGLVLVQLFWFRPRALVSALFVALTVTVLTVVVWPGWILDWVLTVVTFRCTPGTSIWPWGLLAWPVVLVAFRDADYRRQAVFVAAATLLSSPHLLPYHCTTLLVLTDSPVILLLSWLMVFVPGLGWLLPAGGWVLPAGVILWEVYSRKGKK